MKASVVLPVLYHEPQLEETLGGLAGVRDRLDFEIVVVVDVPDRARESRARASNDGLAKRWGARVEYRLGERGFGSALRHGFRIARGDVVVPMMADASEDPRDLPRLVEAAADADVVAGSRYMRGGRVVGDTAKQQLSRLYSILCRAAGGPRIHDVSNAFKAYRRSVIDSVDTVAESFDISVELTVRAAAAGYRVTEIPTAWFNRRKGRSSFSILREVANYGRWLGFAWRNRRGGGRRRTGPREG